MIEAAFFFELVGRAVTFVCAIVGLVVIMNWAFSASKKPKRRG